MPAPAIEMLLDARAAALGHPALVTSTVADITGTPARTYRDWVTDHAAEFRARPPTPFRTRGMVARDAQSYLRENYDGEVSS
jgi:hypothetical protein